MISIVTKFPIDNPSVYDLGRNRYKVAQMSDAWQLGSDTITKFLR